VAARHGRLEAALLLRPGGRTDLEGEEVVQEVLGCGVLVEAPDEVGDRRLEVVVGDHRGVQEQPPGPAVDGVGLRRGHALEHLQVEVVGQVEVIGQHEGPGDVEEVVAGGADLDRPGRGRAERDIEEVLVAGVDLRLVGRRRLWPAVDLGVDPLDGEVGALDDPDLDRPPTAPVTLLGPGAEVGEHGGRIREVGLHHDAGVEVDELVLAEDATEGRDGQVQVVVGLHVEVHERRRDRGAGCSVQGAKSLREHVDGAVERQRVDLRVDRGDLDRDVVDVRPGDGREDRLEPVPGLVLAEHGLAQRVDVLVVARSSAAREVTSQSGVLARQDHPGGLAAEASGDQGHDGPGGEGGRSGPEPQREAVQGARHRGDALAGHEVVKASGGPFGVADPGDLVGQGLDEGPARGIPDQASEPLPAAPVSPAFEPVGRVEEGGRQRDGTLGQRPVIEGSAGHPPVSPPGQGVALDVGEETFGQQVGVGQGGEVAAGHLVRGDAESVADDAALERGGEEAVVLAQQEPGRHVGPGVERARRGERAARLLVHVVDGGGDEVGIDVVEEHRLRRPVVGVPAVLDRLRPERGVVARRVPPLATGLPGTGHHRRDQHQEVDRHAFAHQRRDQAAERLGHDDEVAAGADGVDDHVDVVPQPRGLVGDGQVHGDRGVPRGLEAGDDEVPVPAVGAGTVDQDEGGHVSETFGCPSTHRRPVLCENLPTSIERRGGTRCDEC
jgi:hypothetical protein